MSGYRPQYTQDEEKKIVDYIVEHNSIHRIKGDRLWQEIEEAGIVNRTWQSLKQHFRKQMIHHLHYKRYKLDVRTVENFREVFNKPAFKKTNANKSTNSKDQGNSKDNTGEKTERVVANLLELDSSSSDDSN